MTRLDLLQVDRMKFKLVLAGKWTQKPAHLLISIAIQILDEGNSPSLPALYLIGISALQTLISPCHKYWIPALYSIGISTLKTLISLCHKYWITDLEKTENINILTQILQK